MTKYKATQKRNHKAEWSFDNSRTFDGRWTGLYICSVCGEILRNNGASHDRYFDFQIDEAYRFGTELDPANDKRNR